MQQMRKYEPLLTRFDSAICEIAQHNYQQALDQLFYIQQNHADFKEGTAREMIITIINTLAPNNPKMVQKYRTQLAGLLSVWLFWLCFS